MMFLGIIPLVSHGLSMECLSWSPWDVWAWPCLRSNLPGAQTCATKSTEAAYVSKELLKDLLYLLPGREPRILFYFLSYLYF